VTVTELTPKQLGGLPVRQVEEAIPYINLLVYGDPGSGKTVLAGSADAVPELRPVIHIDVEGGTFSLKDFHPEVDVVRVQSWEQLQQVYDQLHRERGAGYKTAVLDSVTEMQKFSMYGIMGKLKVARPDLDEDIPGMREWGKNIEQVRKMIRAFRDLPMNCIFTALDRKDQNKRTGLTEHRPSLSGKVADEVAGFIDIVAYMYNKFLPVQGGMDGETENHRFLLTQKTDEYVAKDRSNKLPQVVQDPDMKVLHQLIYS
jgi:hypothetical protein